MLKNLTLTPILALTLIGSSANAATIIASWDVWGDVAFPQHNADFTTTGVTASINPVDNSLAAPNSSGNTTGTFGPTLTGASTADTIAMRTQRPSAFPSLDFTVDITNSTGSALTLDELLFDMNVASSTFDDYSVVFYNVTLDSTSAVLGSATGLDDGWAEVAIDASSVTLGNGESGQFIITLTQSLNTDTGGRTSFDNVAVTAIPEPSAMILSALGSLLLLRRRRI